MPCRDYMDEPHPSTVLEDLRARNDMLSRIACRALEHIEKSGDGLEILVLQDPEIQAWWRAHKEADRKAAEAERRKLQAAQERDRLQRVKEELLAKLTPDEKKALKLK